MAFAGALIVMSGLTILFLIISQLHKVVDRPTRKRSQEASLREAAEIEDLSGADDSDMIVCWPLDLPRTAEHLKSLTASLGSDFQLAELHSVLIQNDIPHPHLTINCLRNAGLLKPMGEGVFCWH
jgi:hypothetical protein